MHVLNKLIHKFRNYFFRYINWSNLELFLFWLFFFYRMVMQVYRNRKLHSSYSLWCLVLKSFFFSPHLLKAVLETILLWLLLEFMTKFGLKQVERRPCFDMPLSPATHSISNCNYWASNFMSVLVFGVFTMQTIHL